MARLLQRQKEEIVVWVLARLHPQAGGRPSPGSFPVNRLGFVNATDTTGLTVHPSVVDSRSYAINTHFNTAYDLVTPALSTPRSRCKVYNSGPWGTTNNVGQAATWDSESYDSNALHSISSANSRITIPTGGDVGVWMLIAQISWTANVTGYRAVEIRKNGTTSMAWSQVQAAAGAVATIQNVYAIDDAPTVGDYYEVWIMQGSGGNLNAIGTAPYNSFFSAAHLW